MPIPSAAKAQPDIDRRSILATLAAAGVTLAGATAEAQEGHEHHMQHGGHDEHTGHGAVPQHEALIDAALDCIKKGAVCSNHCIRLLGEGDTSLADCLQSVSAMLPACTALARLAALDAKRLPQFAKVCADICADCQAVCKKHEQHHAVCKACGEACRACADECRKLI